MPNTGAEPGEPTWERAQTEPLAIISKQIAELLAEQRDLYFRLAVTRQQAVEEWRTRVGQIVPFAASRVSQYAKFVDNGYSDHFPAITGNGSTLSPGEVPYEDYRIQAVRGDHIYFDHVSVDGKRTYHYSALVDDCRLEPPSEFHSDPEEQCA